ncbi:hypothetical protein GIB67_013419 [Kingdonia uniflora]|uniref:BAH domain-containing protein n=1 Tax=Kingdonia uniflora TaxID=39325 RepID=A0A7J7LR95_9MAGN|nr:hypothetical protein GIB67_013419 [Kingdonia uniflora]
MSPSVHGFLEWREDFVSQERGSRVVHYYLKDRAGDSILAVVGTERSLRHMVYVVSETFSEVYCSERSINAGFKWRSRREVVDWLTSLLSKRPRISKSPRNDVKQAFGYPDFSTDGLDAPRSRLVNHNSQFAGKFDVYNSDIVWSGDAWKCGKQLKHYPAFCRNGTTITIHSFVFVMAQEENHYVAYLEDMYEDRKGQKKVRARWFHNNREVECVIPLPNPHPREVFITPYAQVISAECVDGPATVLTPEHYGKCLAILSDLSSARVHLCCKEFRSNRVKLFDVSKLRGYFEQTILSCLEEEFKFNVEGTMQGAKSSRNCKKRQRFITSQNFGEGSEITACGPIYQNMRFLLQGRRPMAVKYIPPEVWVTSYFKANENVEILCQDSGIRGCWFRCTVLVVSRKQLKVQYDDLMDEDGHGNLEEWVPAFRPAALDKLGMRSPRRLTIRPCPPSEDSTNLSIDIGAAVDVWWNDGWWEGVVTEIDNCGNDSLHIYFPGEDMFSTFSRKDIRSSKEWLRDRWIDIEAKPDILSVISKRSETGSAIVLQREVPLSLKLDPIKEDNQELTGLVRSFSFKDNLKWVNSRKRQWVEGENKQSFNNGEDEDRDEEDGHTDNNADDTMFDDELTDTDTE